MLASTCIEKNIARQTASQGNADTRIRCAKLIDEVYWNIIVLALLAVNGKFLDKNALSVRCPVLGSPNTIHRMISATINHFDNEVIINTMEVTNVLKLLADNPEGTFLEFSQFNGKHFGTCGMKGISPGWEMHPDTDEFFYVIEGIVEITLLEDQPRHYIAPAGTSFVVPQGVWHKPGAPEGAKFIYFTPGQSLYSESEDPRMDNNDFGYR